VGDGVREVYAAVKIGLPILRENAEIVFPAASVQTFANRVGDIS
jgi:hypothetical protein